VYDISLDFRKMCLLSRIHANGADIPWGRGDRQLVAGRLPLLPPDEPLSPVGGREREFAAENARKLQRVVRFSEALRAAAGCIGAGQAGEVSNDLCDTLFEPNFPAEPRQLVASLLSPDPAARLPQDDWTHVQRNPFFQVSVHAYTAPRNKGMR
jgi:hypothetical protein